MAFRSKFAGNEKLERCADDDAAHLGLLVTPRSELVGEHIALIHEALNTWALKQTPRVGIVAADEVRDKRFGQSTSEMVALYKTMQVPPILNYKREIDPIVGKKTVAALDLELPARTDPKPDPAPTRTRIDIVIKLRGALVKFDTPLKDDEILPDSRIKTYLERQDRLLLRIGQTTHTIRQEAAAPLHAIALRVDAALKGADAEGFERGKICLYGSSSGGRNVIDLGARLRLRGIASTYIAAMDAAFFPNESLTQPANRPGDLLDTEIPKFNMPNPRAGTQKSFFQRIGNHKKERTFNSPLFTSNMGGEEVHGNVEGFDPRDLTTAVRAHVPSSDDEAHIRLTKVASDEVLKDIVSFLNAE